MNRLLERMRHAFSSWFLSAYRRPLRVLLGLIVLPMVGLFIPMQLASVSLWRRQTLHNLGVTARLAAEIVDETLEDTFRFEEMLAADPRFQDAVARRDVMQLGRRLEDVLAFTPRVELALVLSPEGTVIASVPDQAAPPDASVAQEEPFRGAQADGWHPYLSAVYLRATPPAEKVVGVVMPILRGRDVIGLLQFQHRVEEIKSWLQKIRVEPTGSSTSWTTAPS